MRFDLKTNISEFFPLKLFSREASQKMWLFLRARFKTSVRGAAFLTSTLRQLGQLKNARTFGRTVDKLYNCTRHTGHKRSSTKSVRIRDGGQNEAN